VAVAAVQTPMWEANTRAFWITPGFFFARWTIQNTFTVVLTTCLPGVIAGLAGLGLAALIALRRRERSPELEAAAMLGMGVVAGLALMVAIHLAVRPFVVERYLAAFVPPIMTGLALGLGVLGTRLPGWGAAALYLGIAGSGLAGLVDSTRNAIAMPGWDQTARQVAARLARCPDSPVHTDPRWNADVIALPPADNRAVVPFAYATMARRYGFRVEPPGSRRTSPRCPTLFWAEHATIIHPSAAQVLVAERRRGFPVTTLRQYWYGIGWIAEAR